MVDTIDLLKTHARILHRDAQAGDAAALARLKRIGDLRGLDPDATAAAVRRRHCLAALARELGFDGWSHAARVLRGQADGDFGRLLYRSECDTHINIWSATYDEARSIRERHGGFLLAYREQFLIVDADFIRTLGLDPADPDWERIGRDWARPRDVEARDRLLATLVRASLEAASMVTAPRTPVS